MKSLAICIPTYRRPEMLRRCILSAIESARSRPIRVVVTDDSVTDANVATLRPLCTKYPFIEWHRNPVNLGIDRNIQEAVARSTCDFAWLIGEDDIFLPGAIAEMYDYVQQADESYVFCNYQFANEDFSAIVGVACIAEGLADLPVRRFIADQLWSVGFIGSTLVQLAAWNTTSPEPYRDTYFTHVGRVIDMLASQTQVPVHANPAIANRSQGADTFTWKHDSFGVFFGFEKMCRIAAQRHPELASALDEAVANYRKRSGYLSVKSTFRLRAQGAFDRRQFKVYIRNAQIETWRKVWLAFLAHSPRLALRPIAAAYLAWVRHRGGPSLPH